MFRLSLGLKLKYNVCYGVRLLHLNKDYLLTYLLTYFNAQSNPKDKQTHGVLRWTWRTLEASGKQSELSGSGVLDASRKTSTSWTPSLRSSSGPPSACLYPCHQSHNTDSHGRPHNAATTDPADPAMVGWFVGV